MRITPFLVTALLVSTSAHAGGYRVSLQGQKAQGMGHTGVAMTDSAEVVFFNPAGMVALENNVNMSGSLNLLSGETAYGSAATNANAKTDTPVSTPISAYYSRRHSDNLSYGIGVYTPYGSRVHWPTDWAGSHLVNKIELASLYIQPTIAYRLNETFSVGFGINYVIGAVEFNRNLSTSLANANGRSNVTLKASGVDAWGYNLGFLAKLNEQTTLGVSYRSQVDLKARGESADFENIPAALSGIFSDTTFDADLVLPAEFTAGISHKLENNKTTLAFDFNRTYWDAYEELRIDFANNAPTSVNPRNYKDSNIFRFGLQHEYNDSWTIRTGIYFDETPVRDGYFAPETPRNDSTGFTFGTSYQYSDALVFDFSLLYLRFSEIDNSYDFYVESGTTSPFSGTYETTATNFGFGLTYNY